MMKSWASDLGDSLLMLPSKHFMIHRRPTTRVQLATLEKEMKLKIKTNGSRADDGVDLSWSHFLKIGLNPHGAVNMAPCYTYCDEMIYQKSGAG